MENDNVKNVNELDDESKRAEFDRIFNTIGKSNTSIPSAGLLSILGGIVNSSGPETEDVKKFAEALKGSTPEELISKTVLFTCNSIVINLWNHYGKQFEEFYQRRLDEEKKKAEAEPDVDVGGKA